MQSNLVNYKDVGSAKERDIDNTDSKENRLEFTGNWFIDAGILGFVNLMEEVYGWNLEELQKIPESELKNRFVYAFWYIVIRDTAKRWIQKDNFKKKEFKSKYDLDDEKIKENIKNKYLLQIEEKNNECIKNFDNINAIDDNIISINNLTKEILKEEFEKYKDALKKTFATNKKTILENLTDIGIVSYNDFFTNLGIFNPSSNKKTKEGDLLSSFRKLVNEDEYFVRKEKELPVDVFDKSLTPFIFSASDFYNEYYGKPMTLKNLQEILGINPTYFILSFPLSFIWINGKNYLFYTNSLYVTYHINKSLKILKEDGLNIDLFRITWKVIIDKVIEHKAEFSLENMYLIEYAGIKNQQIQNVEYIGISKLLASIILDDRIRDSLNKNIQFRITGKPAWLLENFIKNKPLYPLISQHLWMGINGHLQKNQFISKTASLYALAIDANIKQFNENNTKRLFSADFFRGYEWLLDKIKEDYKIMFRASYDNMGGLFKDSEDREKILHLLFSAVENHNKKEFLYVIIKNLLEKRDTDKVLYLNKYLFENILNNDVCWENYALSLIVNIADN